MSLSEETLEELEEMRDSLETVAQTDVPLASLSQALLEELDSSEESA